MSKFVGFNLNENKHLSERQQNIINGCLLGDGNITKQYNVANFRYVQTARNQERVEEIRTALLPFSSELKHAKHFNKGNGKTYFSVNFSSHSHKLFVDLYYKWYDNGRKIVPRDLVLNPEILANWFQDDGHNAKKKPAMYLYTNGFCELDVEFLQMILFRDLQIISTKQKARGGHRLYMGVSQYERAQEIISPFVTSECMKYKILREV